MIGVWLGYRIISDELYAEVFGILAKGIGITTFATVSPFGLASALGLLRRLEARLHQSKTEHQSADR